MNFGVASIFKDELDYTLEWMAWHLHQGFDHFFMADNNSTDGTVELLEALEILGICSVLRIPETTKQQELAYQRLLARWGHRADAWAFIDSDEYICPEPGFQGRATDLLRAIFAKENTGAVGLNWRGFGSGGAAKREPGLVPERFLSAFADQRFLNNHIKSVLRPSAVRRMYVHHAELTAPHVYRNADGEQAEFFSGHSTRNRQSEPSEFLADFHGRLCVNHYIIKSRQEYFDKKSRRLWSNPGQLQSAVDSYLAQFDVNDVRNEGALAFMAGTHRQLEILTRRLHEETHFFRRFRGHVESCTRTALAGWCVAQDRQPVQSLQVRVLVNGRHAHTAAVYRHRQDVINAGLSVDGRAGFWIVFPEPLRPGDRVQVGVLGNQFDFNRFSWVVPNEATG